MLRELRFRIRALLRRSQLDRDLQDELADHMARRGDSGRAPFGNVTLVREQMRDTWTFPWLEDFGRDLRLALRALRKTPGQTTAIVALLALGIGANSAIFSILKTVLLDEVPVSSPDGLIALNRLRPDGLKIGAFSTPSYRGLAEQLTTIDVLASGTLSNPQLKMTADAAEEVAEPVTSLVSGNFFQLLGVPAALGRVFTPDDDRYQDPHPLMVLSHDFWQRQFGSDRGVVGRQVFLHNVPFTIVGVMPESFRGMGRDFWIPLNMQPAASGGEDVRNNQGRTWLLIVSRLKPGVVRDRARSEVEAVFNRLSPPPPGQAPWKLSLDPGQRSFGYSGLDNRYGTPLKFLMGAVVMLLLIACANVASILLARAGARQQEIAVRQAIGCGRSRIMRQVLTESLLFAVGGAGAGLLLAVYGSQALISLTPLGTLDVVFAGLDTRVLVFTISVSVMSALLCGLAPAIRASRIQIDPILKGASRGNTSTRSNLWMNRVFVATQAALSMILVVGAALFAASLYRLYRVDPGYSTERILSATVNARNLGYTEKGGDFAALARRITDRLTQLPGVQSASVSAAGFLSQSARTTDAFFEGPQGPVQVDNIRVDQGSPTLLETMGIPLLAGRAFQPSDRRGSPLVVIVNEQFARQHFAGRNPVGARIHLDDDNAPPVEIIGVAGDAKLNDVREQPIAIVYLSIDQFPYRFNFVNVRTSGPASAVLQMVGQAIREVEPRLRPSRIETLETSLDRVLSRDILLARLSTLFGGLALLVACFGVYGMLSYVISERTSEIGIRLALGAPPAGVRFRIIADALKMVVPGLVLGIVGALAGARFIESLLFDVNGRDPRTYLIASVALTITTVFAAFLPARRAVRIDPMTALRAD
jgi:predicted permease